MRGTNRWSKTKYSLLNVERHLDNYWRITRTVTAQI